jgi:hypothetical protein
MKELITLSEKTVARLISDDRLAFVTIEIIQLDNLQDAPLQECCLQAIQET